MSSCFRFLLHISFFFLWFIYSRLNGVSEALVYVCVCVMRVAERKQKLHNFGDISFFVSCQCFVFFFSLTFKQWVWAKSCRSPSWFYGFRMAMRIISNMDFLFAFFFIVAFIDRLAIINTNTRKLAIKSDFDLYQLTFRCDQRSINETKNCIFYLNCVNRLAIVI